MSARQNIGIVFLLSSALSTGCARAIITKFEKPTVNPADCTVTQDYTTTQGKNSTSGSDLVASEGARMYVATCWGERLSGSTRAQVYGILATRAAFEIGNPEQEAEFSRTLLAALKSNDPQIRTLAEKAAATQKISATNLERKVAGQTVCQTVSGRDFCP